MIPVGQYLKNIRINRNLSLRDVFKATGITDSKLSRIENESNSEPEPLILKALADFYSLDLINLYQMAGYLDEKSLLQYKFVFDKADLLTEREKNLIQEQIYLFTKGRGCK